MKDDYLSYLKRDKTLSVNQIIYLDSASYIKFGTSVFPADSSYIYFGTFSNDSVSIKKRRFLRDDQACMGKMKKEIEYAISSFGEYNDITDHSINLSNYVFKYLVSDKELISPKTKKNLKYF